MDQEGRTQYLFSELAKCVQYNHLSKVTLTNSNFSTADLESLLGTSPLTQLVLINSRIEGHEYTQLLDLMKFKFHLSSPREEFRYLDSETGIDWPMGPEIDEIRKDELVQRFIFRKVWIWE
jgi:hypothetical protein